VTTNPPNSDTGILARIPFFRDLTQAQLADIARRLREDAFEADDAIFYEDDPALRFWVVKEGQVKIIRYSASGKEVVIEVISPGEIFGGAAMLMSQQPASARALSDARTLSIPVEEYKHLLQDYPSIAVHVIEALGNRMLDVIRIRTLASERVERRIAHILLKLAAKSGLHTPEGWQLQISLTRQDIADLADTTIETAIRVMSGFAKQGLVKTQRGGYLIITRVEDLKAIAEG
jgi:CRP-like cAMP-binding protein